MQPRPFGATGLSLSPLGLGAGQIGSPDLDETKVAALLEGALDLGVNFIDTARSYGLSEARIGRHLAHRRDEVVLSTKVGYGIEGVPDWSAEAVTRGIEEARQRLRADVIDVVHLHSCPLHTLEGRHVIDALNEAVHRGHIKVAAYSGENDELRWAIDSSRFGAVQTSVNLCDQRDIDTALVDAAERGIGRIAKRAVANAPWRFAERPHGHYAETYWDRLQTMNLEVDLPWQELALRFVAWSANVDTCIVGTSALAHLEENVRVVERGPLEDEVVEMIRARFRVCDEGWVGQI